MKKITTMVVVIIVAFCIVSDISSLKKPEVNTNQIAKQSYTPTDEDEKLYHDALSAFLAPHVDKAIEEWYSKNPQYTGGTVDPWSIKILSVERIPDQTSKLWFCIKVEVMPYVLAHISVGRDQITFMLKPTGEVTVEKFEHIESYDYLKWRRLPKTNQ